MTRTHPGRFHIAIPGPTNIPERILNAMHISSEDQRNPEIPDLTIPLYKDVKKVFKSEKGTVFLFPGSGTGAWEAAHVNLLEAGDLVLMVETGHFATLWYKMATRLGLETDFLATDWRRGADAQAIEACVAVWSNA